MTHGLGGYINHKCRCDVCREAQSRYARTRYEETRGFSWRRQYLRHQHGTMATYGRGCRCDACQSAYYKKRHSDYETRMNEPGAEPKKWYHRIERDTSVLEGIDGGRIPE